MNMIDSHCHPQLSQYDEDRDFVVQRALSGGIGMICVGTDLVSSRTAIQLAEKYEGVWASVGLHPNDNLDELYDDGAYERLASSSAKVIAIGEVGLDYFRTTNATARSVQKERFEKQLELAERLHLPLIIHCRDAHEDMATILGSRQNRGVIHSFTGTPDEVDRYVSLGLHIGINGIATFTDQYNESIQAIPEDRILAETDAPFLAPVPHRGTRNEPIYVLEVVRRLADIRGQPYETLIRQLEYNTRMLFDIPVIV